MSIFTLQFVGATAILFAAASVSPAQESDAPRSVPGKAIAAARAAGAADAARNAEVAPMAIVQTSAATTTAAQSTLTPVPAAATPAAAQPTTTETTSVTESGGVGVREFQGDDVGQVLRLLARQAKINMVVSEAVTGT